MMMSLFNQFASPLFLWVPLALPAMMAPYLLTPKQPSRWLSNRWLTLLRVFLITLSKHIFMNMNKLAHSWALLLSTLMLFLTSMNLLGLLPYTFTPTTQLSLNLGLAIPLWLATVLIGFRKQLSAALAHFLPEGTPTPLTPVLIIIETVSLIIRPLALGVRLTANLTAGHLLIHLTSMATMTLMSSSVTTAALTFIALVMLTILEIAVAMIQAYVFVLLLSLYLRENT